MKREGRSMDHTKTLENMYEVIEKMKNEHLFCSIEKDERDPYVLYINIKDEEGVMERIEYDTKFHNVIIGKQEHNNKLIQRFLQLTMDVCPEQSFFIIKTENCQIDNIDFPNYSQETLENGISISKTNQELIKTLHDVFDKVQNRFIYSHVRAYKYTNYYRFCVITIWGIYAFEIHPCHLKHTYILQRKKQDDILLTINDLANEVEDSLMKTFQAKRIDSVFNDGNHPFYHLMNNHLQVSVRISKHEKEQILSKLKTKFKKEELFHHCFQFMTTHQHLILSTGRSFFIPFPNHIIVGIYGKIYEFCDEKEALLFFQGEKNNAPDEYTVTFRKTKKR